MDISIVVCTYNPTEEELKISLDSLVKQKDVEYEIVITDDGSDDCKSEFVNHYFLNSSFKNYIHKQNIINNGTIINIIEGLDACTGRYIYTMGQGDALSDEYVIRDVVRFMDKNKANCIFTKMIPFEWRNSKRIIRKKKTPMLVEPWRKQDYKRIKENVLVFNDQISGASIFFESSYCVKMMNIMRLSTKYMEDLFQYISLLDGDKIYYLDRTCVLYECGVGISNSSNPSSMNRMRTDKNNFLNFIFEYYQNDVWVKRRKKLEMIEREECSKIKKIIRKMLSEPKWIYFRALRMINRKL